jgi:hypothetical protein
LFCYFSLGDQGCSTLYTESVKQHWLTI